MNVPLPTKIVTRVLPPIDVTAEFGEDPDVAEAAVLDADDEQYGQRLVAFVVVVDGAAATPADLKAHVKENLASYEVPRSITVLKGLPRSSTGKILRRELQQLVPTNGDGTPTP